MADRQHTADCYRYGCKVGAHPLPRPGHVAGGPWTPEEVLAGKHLPAEPAQIRQHPLHRVITGALRDEVLLGGSVLDHLGDLLVRAVLDNLPTIDGKWAITPTLEHLDDPLPNITTDPDVAARRRAAAVLERAAARLRAGEDL